MTWTFAARTGKSTPSLIRDLNRIVQESGRIINLAAGMPSSETFPVAEFALASERVLSRGDGASSLQYSASEGLHELRQAVADNLPWTVDPGLVLITNGSQQGLDLVGRALIDKGSRVLVERPTYPGALQAFAAFEPTIADVRGDENGIDLPHLEWQCDNGEKPRFMYVLPTFQNPTGRTINGTRRGEYVESALRMGLPLVEDNPYGDLWYDQPPPPPLAALDPDNTVYLGTFSKVLAPGLRIGFAVAPKQVHQRLVAAKQAADLQPSTFVQYLVVEVIKDGFLQRQVESIRAKYKAQRDTMVAALSREFAKDGADVDNGLQWNVPDGGMFVWARLPDDLSADALLRIALDKGVAFVPGSAFQLHGGDDSTLRLSFVTATAPEIDTAISLLGQSVRALRGRRSKS